MDLKQITKTQKIMKLKQSFLLFKKQGILKKHQNSNNVIAFWPKLTKRKGVQSEEIEKPFILFQGLLPPQIT